MIRIIGNNCTKIGKVSCLTAGGEDAALVVGWGTSIESGVFIARDGSSPFLGEDCMVSNHVMIRTSDGQSTWDIESETRLGVPAPVVVGHHVWLGNNSRVSKGVHIGEGAIVGQISLVTHDIQPRTLNVRIPAKIRSGVRRSRSEAFDDLPKSIRTGKVWRSPKKYP